MVKRKNIEPKVKEKILDFATLLRRKGIEVDKIILYGSYAKGRAKAYSDIDLCLVSPKFSQNQDYYFKKIWHLAAKIDPSLEPIPFTPQELANKYSTLSCEIKKYGQEIKI